jgi:hypothetical protein
MIGAEAEKRLGKTQSSTISKSRQRPVMDIEAKTWENLKILSFRLNQPVCKILPMVIAEGLKRFMETDE